MDVFPASEASELFVEYLNENMEVYYDGINKKMKDLPIKVILENRVIKVIYIYKSKDDKIRYNIF